MLAGLLAVGLVLALPALGAVLGLIEPGDSPMALAVVPALPVASTTTVFAHNTSHQSVTSSEAGQQLHPYVTVKGTAGTAAGSVVVQRYTGGTCTTVAATSASTPL